MLPIPALRARLALSERELANKSRVARGSLRKAALGHNATVASYEKVGAAMDRVVLVALHPLTPCDSAASTVAVAARTAEDGPTSWRLHFMELVDAFRRTLDPRLILLPPAPGLCPRLEALLASIVSTLAFEAQIDTPEWAQRQRFLEQPFFPAEMESLKASALRESPTLFRRNNIFVLENFMQRA